MADKSFGVKDINLIGASGTPTIDSPNNLNINAVNVAISTDMSVGGDVGIGSASPIKKLDVRGETTFGEGMQESDFGPWGPDTNQRAYFFSGALSATGANSDGTIALVNPNNNPNNTRVGTIVFGNSVSGTSATSNAGLKAAIDVYTNANVTNAADTGGSLRFLTKPDNGNLREVARFNSSGDFGIGTNDPESKLTIAGDSATAQIEIKRTNVNASGTVGALNFTASDGHSVANISAVGDGDNEGAHLVFRTTSAAGENSPFGGSTVERLRIDSSGRVTTPSQAAALVYKTGTNQTYSSDAIVNYDATSYSQGGMTINASRNRITVPVAGKYMITACASGSCTTASAGDGWNLKILRDGSTYNDADGYPIETTGSEAGQELAYTLSMVVDAAANDYFEIEIGNVGSARATISRGYFGIYLLG